jgi:hypothetical protein
MVDGSSRALVADVFDFALGIGSPLEMRVWRKRGHADIDMRQSVGAAGQPAALMYTLDLWHRVKLPG